MYLLHIVVYKKNRACLKEVEKSLQCFGVHPQIIRLAQWDEDFRGNLKHDKYATKLDLVFYGLSVHQ